MFVPTYCTVYRQSNTLELVSPEYYLLLGRCVICKALCLSPQATYLMIIWDQKLSTCIGVVGYFKFQIQFVPCFFGRFFSTIRVYRTVKVKVKVKFTLEQATKAQSGSRGIALPFP